ncbi:ubiquitin-protein ligase [Vibrio sp. UCD-FRSSP16_10]|uniref:DUF3943 domain-containing protein n=1 Tax=unclassified Vibrio TaxID=2614977 RepID=UPI000801A534|nr:MULTISPECIES: DUF3943 domain-containing protein [unclassified Vibrio]OBT13480.1 ubiquitin-protein ligase [Vibrio sp. UCD-FRSSP16_10]OBT17989.1 ubiquitin-protein ligase [Vibrio sp. UCD-FRSSP16_30]
MHLKKLTTSLLGLISSAAIADYDRSQHIELSYESTCNNSYQYCMNQPNDYRSLSLDDSEQQLDIQASPYPMHYTISDGKDWDYLAEQTYTILGLSIATVGLMTLLPESITKWEDDDRDLGKLGDKWVDNVTSGPTWDRDEHFLNYIMHPYFGGVYYTAARHAGFNEFESFAYSFTMSTFFWEYGVEAFAEVPSWQDLFITPVFGAVVGELMLQGEQNILADGGRVLGSETMGDISLFFLNPVGQIHYWITDSWGGEAQATFVTNPWFGYHDAAVFALDAGAPYDKQFFGMQLHLRF